MFYVYYLQSQAFLDKTYIGFTRDFNQRFAEHNAGKSVYTKDFKPWMIVSVFIFHQEYKALRFERYLKSNAGRIFLGRYVVDGESSFAKKDFRKPRLTGIRSVFWDC